MKTRIFRAVALSLCLAGAANGAINDELVREAIVKIYTVRNTPNYYNPWANDGPRQSTGTGCIIEGNRILTNGHVVGDQTFLQVRRNGESKRLQARLLAVSHEADLALLTVDDPTFFEDITPLRLDALPDTQEEVVVYGFPLGGDTMSITKGVLSRIEHQRYAHSSCTFLAGQIDAAINPGNSGGPVIVDGRIVGVVMQAMSQAENIGYMVPVPIIRHFLTDIVDGRYDNFPSLGVVLQDMENPSLKAKYQVEAGETGVLVTMILPDAPGAETLQVGDVITAVDGHPVADDGTVEFRPKQRTKLSYYVQLRQVGESIPLGLLRDGEPKEVTIRLSRPLTADWLVPMEQYDVLPSYYIYGGIVFCPLTKNLLREWGGNWYNAAPKELVALLRRNFPDEDRDEVVLALKVLAADVNQGYHNLSNWMIHSVNGERVRNLRHLVDLVETSSDSPYMQFGGESGQHLVLDRAEVERVGAGILELYRIKSDRSPDLE